MEQLEVIDRLMRATGDWPTTLNLIEKYPLKKPDPILLTAPDPAQLPEPAPKIDIDAPISVARKRFKIKEGKLSNQLMEALEHFPGSTVEELLNLTGRDDESKSAVSTTCKKLCEKKVLIRSKNDRGLYAYRIAATH